MKNVYNRFDRAGVCNPYHETKDQSMGQNKDTGPNFDKKNADPGSLKCMKNFP